MVRRWTALAVVLVAMSASAETAIAKCVQELHVANLQRQAWGDLTVSRSQTGAVKQLGDRLKTDHVTLDGALMQYAGSNGIALKDTPLEQTGLTALVGSRFDAAFLGAIDRHNTAMLRTVESCRALSAEPQLRRVMNKTLATYREHQREVDRAYRELLPAT